MSPRAYLKSNLPILGILLAAALLIVFVLEVAGVNRYITALAGIIALAGAVAALSIDYLRKRSFYSDLA